MENDTDKGNNSSNKQTMAVEPKTPKETVVHLNSSNTELGCELSANPQVLPLDAGADSDGSQGFELLHSPSSHSSRVDNKTAADTPPVIVASELFTPFEFVAQPLVATDPIATGLNDAVERRLSASRDEGTAAAAAAAVAEKERMKAERQAAREREAARKEAARLQREENLKKAREYVQQHEQHEQRSLRST